jgi:hypothetical protein
MASIIGQLHQVSPPQSVGERQTGPPDAHERHPLIGAAAFAVVLSSVAVLPEGPY